MPRVEPIKQYVDAVLSMRDKHPEMASSYLARSLGSKKIKTPPVLRNNIKKLLTPNTLANDAMLKIVSAEVSKRRKP